jgi:hypothetical protein
MSAGRPAPERRLGKSEFLKVFPQVDIKIPSIMAIGEIERQVGIGIPVELDA